MLALAVVLGAFASTTWAAPPVDPPAVEANAIVTFRGPFVDRGLIESAGGQIVSASAAIGVAGVHAPDYSSFAQQVRTSPRVLAVETNDAVFADATGWDAIERDAATADATGAEAATWSATQWDATQWDNSTAEATQWDATQWDATQWDATQWDATQWDATQWDRATGQATQRDATQWDATQWDATQWDATQWDATRWDGRLWSSSYLTSLSRGNGIDPLKPLQWGFAAVHGGPAQAIYAGQKAKTLCVVDSGIDYYHPDLARNVRTTPETGTPGKDFVNGDNDPGDDAGHGTAVAGAMVGVLTNHHGVAGLAREKIIAAKVLDARGVGTELNLALGIDFCVRNGAHVIVLSLSTDQDSPAVRAAVENARLSGVGLVAAAGNVGRCLTCVRYPAAYPGVIAVGAVMPSGNLAPYSAVGPKVSMVAPGWGVVTTFPDASYAAVNGTSFATPMVAAALALVLEKNPTLNAQKAGGVLAKTARDLGPPGRDPYFGWGALNMEAALRETNFGDPSLLPPLPPPPI